MLIIHIRTDDNGEDLNIIKKLVIVIKEIVRENNVKIAFSGIIHREVRRNCKKMIDDTNKKLKIYCFSVGIVFINNANIDGSSLNRSKLHLNRK